MSKHWEITMPKYWKARLPKYQAIRMSKYWRIQGCPNIWKKKDAQIQREIQIPKYLGNKDAQILGNEDVQILRTKNTEG